MRVPRNGRSPFVSGILPRLVREAEQGRTIYLVMDNIDAAPGGLRVELNPVLWEKEIYIPEMDTRVRIPKNLHLIFTAADDARVKDEAFLDRVLRQKILPMDARGIVRLLVKRYGAGVKSARLLARLYEALRQREGAGEKDGVFIQDLVQVNHYVKGRLADGAGDEIQVLKEEAYRYLHLPLAMEEDRAKFHRVFERIMGPVKPSC